MVIYNSNVLSSRFSNTAVLVVGSDGKIRGHNFDIIEENDNYFVLSAHSLGFPDFIEIGAWRLGQVNYHQSTSISQFSISAHTKWTPAAFGADGTLRLGPGISDSNSWSFGGQNGPTFSTSYAINYGDKAVQIGSWRIREIDSTHLSISNENGSTPRIYVSDGTVLINNNEYSGYKSSLGAGSCAFLTSTYLQIGDWRIGYDGHYHLSVSHYVSRTTSMIYGLGGIRSPGPRNDYDAWTYSGTFVEGTTTGCRSVCNTRVMH